jgi:uncharacterized membrane protein
MEDLLQEIAYYVELMLEAFAIAVIAVGALEAAVGIVRVAMHPGIPNSERRTVWLNFARWLVAGLTFQLAADIVGTSFAPTWDELARLGIIAVIRTFLSFFLDRELDATRELQHDRQMERGRGGAAGSGGEGA